MAQFMHDLVGQPFGYTWPSATDSLPLFDPHSSILDPNDLSQLHQFFDDPNNFKGDSRGFSLDMHEEVKEEGGGGPPVNGQGGYEQNGDTGYSADSGLGHSQNTVDHTGPQQHMTSDVQFGTDTNALQAAHSLFALNPAHGSSSSHAGDMFHVPDTAASWGTLHNPYAPVNTYPSFHAPSPYNQYGQFPTPAQNLQSYPQQAQANWNQNWQHGQIPPTSRHGHTNPQQLQQALRQTHGQRAPPHPTFGTDPNFSRQGYAPPPGWTNLEQSKALNLVHVPLASEAAAQGQLNVNALLPGSNQQTNARFNDPSYNNMSSIGGLPLQSSTSSSGLINHDHPYGNLAVDSAEGSTSNYGSRYPAKPPHKRRTSQMEREDEAEYTPHGHRRGSTSQRVVKTESEYDDDDYTGTGMSASKRRRSSNNFTSSRYEDDAGSPSDDGDITPGSKRKRSALSGDFQMSISRQNLSETEKRQNHIKSEKQRRDLIKAQYEVLDELVPGLKGGKSGLSRADVLDAIAEEVLTNVAGNDAMEELLKQLPDVVISERVGDEDDADGDGDEDEHYQGGEAANNNRGRQSYGTARPSSRGGFEGSGTKHSGDAGG